MSAAFIELSKYILPFFFSIYIFECFSVFRSKHPERKKGIYLRQIICMCIIHFVGYFVILLEKGDLFYLIFYGIQQVLTLSIILIYRGIYPSGNRLTVNNICMLLTISFIVLCRISKDKTIKQFKIIVIAFIISLIIPFLIKKIKLFKNLTWLYAIVGFGMILTVYLLGVTTNGSKISYTIAGFTFQPSEFVKIIFILFVACSLSKSTTKWNLIITSIVAGLHVLVLVASKDLGAALLFFVVYICIFYIATQKFRYLVAGVFVGGMASVCAYFMFSHVRLRFQVWRNPWIDMDGSGYQITQSLFAIGTGGWFGLGIFQGIPTAIPYVESDFIFSAIAEEFGVIFSLCLILLCLSCFIMFMNIAMRLTEAVYKYIAVGLGVMYLFQVFLTIGGGIKFIPLTGVTLPLVSYGGSSILSTLIIFSIIQGLYLIQEKENSEKENLEDDYNEKESLENDEQEKERFENECSFLINKAEKKAIFVTTSLFVLLFLTLMVYLTYFMLRDSKQIINHAFNPRQELLAAKHTRGDILDRNGIILASTNTDVAGNEIRFYPYNNLFAHSVGYSTMGKTGIEALGTYDLLSSHQPMKDKLVANFSGNKLSGDSIVSTLDLDITKIASDALGSYKGAVIVLEVRTGNIIAMVSKPDFDPNKINSIWDDLIEDKKSSVLLNRSTQGLYPPGSIFKIITLLEYIRQFPDTYETYSYVCDGTFKSGEEGIVCYDGKRHGTVNLMESFAYSCNTSFANMGNELNKKSFRKTLNQLMFQRDLPIPLPYSKSSILMDETLSDWQLMQTVIGQGTTQMTPMHVALITSAIANEGVMIPPKLMSEIINCEGSIVSVFPENDGKRIMTKEEASLLSTYMAEVITIGTGKQLHSLDVKVAGKTGSAEMVTNDKKSHGWFTGFAPIEDPEYVVTIIVEQSGLGSDYAVPIAKKLFEGIFNY